MLCRAVLPVARTPTARFVGRRAAATALSACADKPKAAWTTALATFGAESCWTPFVPEPAMRSTSKRPSQWDGLQGDGTHDAVRREMRDPQRPGRSHAKP